MVLEKIYECHDRFKVLRSSYSGLELQVLSYIASFRICNDLEYDDASIFQRIVDESAYENSHAQEFMLAHKKTSSGYFGSAIFDEHERISASEVRRISGLTVNEPTIDILYKRLIGKFLGTPVTVKPMVLMTHDIDKVSYVENPLILLKTVVGDIVKRKLFYPQRIAHFLTKRSVHAKVQELFDDKFEHLYLLLPQRSRLNADYKISYFAENSLFKKSAAVGLHYSYEAIGSKETLKIQFNALKRFNLSRFVRGHYLRRSAQSDEFIEGMNLIDLTPCDAETGGFYVPTSYPFYIHKSSRSGNFVLNTTFMDVTYHFMDASLVQRVNLIRKSLSHVKINGGFFVVNWHNTSFWWGDWPFEVINYSYLKAMISEYL